MMVTLKSLVRAGLAFLTAVSLALGTTTVASRPAQAAVPVRYDKSISITIKTSKSRVKWGSWVTITATVRNSKTKKLIKNRDIGLQYYNPTTREWQVSSSHWAPTKGTVKWRQLINAPVKYRVIVESPRNRTRYVTTKKTVTIKPSARYKWYYVRDFSENIVDIGNQYGPNVTTGFSQGGKNYYRGVGFNFAYSATLKADLKKYCTKLVVDKIGFEDSSTTRVPETVSVLTNSTTRWKKLVYPHYQYPLKLNIKGAKTLTFQARADRFDSDRSRTGHLLFGNARVYCRYDPDTNFVNSRLPSRP